MTSIRRRTLTLIIGLLLAGLAILSTFNVHDSNHEGSREKDWKTCFQIITDESSKIVPAQQTKRFFLVDMHNSNQEEGLRNRASSL